MVPTLHIEKFESGMYVATLEDAGEPMFEEKMFSNVAEVIRYFGEDAPNDLIQFMDIKYSGYGIGTISTVRMKSEPEVLAKDLMSLYSAVINAEEKMQYQKQLSKA
ncbi:hypothetical protein ACEN8I_17055 [Polaromonas sp. CT11-55]|uniref:hypothetical protein n=1 Tax=Polaromonas sp. CT11-55 TaxID=3243045 RepID=UPI0039A6A479